MIRSFSRSRPLWSLGLTFCLLGWSPLVRGQQADPAPATPPPAVEAPAAPAPPPPPDPKLIKLWEAILNQKFSREPNDVLYGLERANVDTATQNPQDRFQQFFRVGGWGKIHAELAQMPADLGRRVYEKLLSDLTEKQKPNVKLEDVLDLADAAPGELTGDQLRKLGQLLSLTVPANETYWLATRLKKGTERLGGSDSTKRLMAGRMLLAANFKELARDYLPPLDRVNEIKDEGVRNEVTSFLTSQKEGEAALRGQVQRIWEENLRILVSQDPKNNEWEQQKAASAIAKIIAQVPATTLTPVLADLVKSNPAGAARLVGGLERKLSNERNNEIPQRVENLKAQATIALQLAELVDPATAPWNQLFDLMMDSWIGEAENTFTQLAVPQGQQVQRFVPSEDLLATAPSGKWEAVLTPPARDRLDVSLSRTILSGANFDPAAERIVAIGKRSPEAGVALAEDFLSVWARTHNPQLPEALRRKYELSDDVRIPVTPLMMEKNIESLARMMALFRQAGLAPRDYTKVVAAFDLAYSNAETYRAAHIEKVFGPLATMEEKPLFLILSRMNANLGERWRKMEVQKAGLTRRDETATLQLVRTGYSTALDLINTWLGGHPGSAHALTLAGTLLSDWGDFEYFQELVASDAKMRMTGYKEKNQEAQEYFKKGADAYAAQVPKLAAEDYSVDAYLGWFNSLLGISSNGQINLSKAMNRAALTRIREHMLALGPKAGPAHLNQLARLLNARLADEKEPLHEDLKYRYLASTLLVTKDDPFTLGAEKKVAYYDELLSEVRLQTRVDGPNTIARDQDFGIIVSIIHTEAMGRVAKFGQYLTNDTGAGAGKPKKKSPLVKKMREAQGPRDELELGLTEKLAPFFDIKSITFAPADVKARPTNQPGWEETVLAYLQVRAKEASVDKIPPVELELKFVDLTGPITIPAESAETELKITDHAAPRPAQGVEITETVDTRQLLINGALSLEIKAVATGFVPELEQLLDLSALKTQLEIKNINPHEGLQVKELNTWGDQVAPRTERLWTVTLDGDAVRAKEGPVDFHFPPATMEATVAYQTYNEMNLVPLPGPQVQIGRALTPAEQVTQSSRHRMLYAVLALLVALALAAAWYLVRRRRQAAGEHTARARDVFKMPSAIDGFSVVALLRKLRTSPLVTLPEPQKHELQSDLQRVQQACFGTSTAALSEADLRTIAEKWLRLAS